MARSIIVISGLPASGKTTLAHLLGEELGFEEAARTAGDVILVSHWQGPNEHRESGTPSAWLREFDTVIEVVCQCSVAVALQRFTSRIRHPGHGDNQSDLIELQQWFEEDSLRSPLGIGSPITVNTEEIVDIKKLALECHRLEGI